MTTLTLQNDYGTYSIKLDREDMSVSDVVDELVFPVLVAAGYDYRNVLEALGGVTTPETRAMSEKTYSGHTESEVIELMEMLSRQHEVHWSDEALAITRKGYALLTDQLSKLETRTKALVRIRQMTLDVTPAGTDHEEAVTEIGKLAREALNDE